MAHSNDYQRIQAITKRNRQLMIARAVFTFLFLLMLVVITVTKNEKVQYLAEGECLRDYTFVWTEKINTFLVENDAWKNFTIIQSSLGIDFMMISYLVIFAYWGTTMRLSCALMIFYPVRNVL